MVRETSHPRVGVAAIMKMEQPYILEWVAWHRLLGFEILIADNGGDDGQSELLSKLGDQGAIRVVDFAAFKILPQIPAYIALFELALADGLDYLGFIDADEFFEPMSGVRSGSGAELIGKLFRDTGSACLGFNWMCFGSSGRESFSPEPVTQRFTRAAGKNAAPNHHIKSFYDLRRCRELIGGGRMSAPLSPHGLNLGDRNYSHDGAHFETGAMFGLTSSVRWENARVRHYVVKSREEFLSRKAARGRSDVIRADQYNEEFRKGHDMNEEEACLPAATLEALSTEMAKISASPAGAKQSQNSRTTSRWREADAVEMAIGDFTTQFRELHPQACWTMEEDLRRYLRERLPLLTRGARSVVNRIRRRSI